MPPILFMLSRVPNTGTCTTGRLASSMIWTYVWQALTRPIGSNVGSHRAVVRTRLRALFTVSKVYGISSQRTCSWRAEPSRKYWINSSPNLKEILTGIKSRVFTRDFMSDVVPYISNPQTIRGMDRKVYFDVYGCQMNVNDMEVVWSILKNAGFCKTTEIDAADVVLMITCAIREGAETKVWNKLELLKGLKKLRTKEKYKPPMKIGILGCMAERLKYKLLEREQAVDVVAGPDSYKDLPRLLALTENGQTAVNVLLSLDETYADVMPVRVNQDSCTAFISIMRGCDNMCTFCIVPFTRGRERSRPISSIVEEVQRLSGDGVKEITLLGQNVNSYRDVSETVHYGGISVKEETHMAKGFSSVYSPKRGGLRFVDLLDKVSGVDPEMRIRFTSPHPKDFPDEVLHLIQQRPNICRNLHLPAQSGNNNVLERMRRGYTREAYLDLVNHIREILPDVTLSSDFICGFCGETDAEFSDTLTLMKEVKYHMAFLFPYSLREKTAAHRRYKDNIPQAVKQQRLMSMTAIFRKESQKLNELHLRQQELVLVERVSKRSVEFFEGRNSGNTKVVFPAHDIPIKQHCGNTKPIKTGDYVVIKVTGATSQILRGIPLYHSSLSEYYFSQMEGQGRSQYLAVG